MAEKLEAVIAVAALVEVAVIDAGETLALRFARATGDEVALLMPSKFAAELGPALLSGIMRAEMARPRLRLAEVSAPAIAKEG